MERASAVTRTLDNNKHFRQLSVARSGKLFFANITLILTFGLEQFWEHVTDSYLTISKYIVVVCLRVLPLQLHGRTACAHLSRGSLLNQRVNP
jgi:hypothetical protein